MPNALALQQYLDEVYGPERLTTHSSYVTIRGAIRRFVQFAGKEVTVDAPNVDMLGMFREWLIKVRGCSPGQADHLWLRVASLLRHYRPDEFPAQSRLTRRKLLPKLERRTLDWCLHCYVSERDIAISSIEQLEFSLDHFARYLDRRPTLIDLNSEAVNGWLTSALREGYAPKTMHGRRGAILSLWKFAFEDAALVRQPPRRVKKIKVPRKLPEAWSLEGLASLLKAAESLDGTFRCGVSKAAYWQAWILVAYESGLRPCDMMVVTAEAIGPGGTIAVVQKKTGIPKIGQLSTKALDAVAALKPRLGRPIFRGLGKHAVFDGWKELMRASGLSGTPKKLRKSSATHLEAAHPGFAGQHLGHLTPGLAYKHYVDPRYLGTARLSPPAIGPSTTKG